MKRCFLFFLVFLIVLLINPFVFGGENTLHVGETVGGVTLLSLSQTEVKVEVSGVKNIIGLDELKVVNSVKIKVVAIYYFGDSELSSAVLDLEGSAGSWDSKTPSSVLLDLKCDGTCSGSDDCCEDCGCEKGYGCVDHICVKSECSVDKDCKDNNFCTLDKCKGTSKVCSNIAITECVINDLCCPSGCTIENDPDCDPSRTGKTEIDTGGKPKEKKEESVISEEKDNESEESTEVNIEEKKEVKKEGFFGKVKKIFSGMFSWIFK